MKKASKSPRNLCGERIKLARMRLKMMQADLCAAMEDFEVQMDRTAITRIENGQRNVYDYELVALAQALEVTIEWLLFGGDLKVD